MPIFFVLERADSWYITLLVSGVQSGLFASGNVSVLSLLSLACVSADDRVTTFNLTVTLAMTLRTVFRALHNMALLTSLCFPIF